VAGRQVEVFKREDNTSWSADVGDFVINTRTTKAEDLYHLSDRYRWGTRVEKETQRSKHEYSLGRGRREGIKGHGGAEGKRANQSPESELGKIRSLRLRVVLDSVSICTKHLRAES